jgi:uncharacterized protein (TIGR03437 family)
MTRNFPAIVFAMLSVNFAFADHIAYTYDAAYRLAKVDYGNGTTISYSYDASGNLLNRTVAKAVSNAPSFTAGSVVNTASFKTGPIAPGEMITVFGTNIGPATLASYKLNNNIVSGFVAGTRFLFDGVAAPIYYVSSGVSTVIVPYEVAGKATTQVVAEYLGMQSAPVTLPVATAAPGLFTASSQGTGQASAANLDGTINSPSNPIARGSVIILFLTGDGQTNPAGVDGQLALTTFPTTAADVSVSFGGVTALAQYAGVAPLSVAGFTQFNVIVPDGSPVGDAVPVVVTVGGASSPSSVTIAIK